MKELSIEEKAKRYDEAIEVAQRLYNNSVAITKKGLEDIFPELKESEDERIRKELIDYLKERKSCESYGQYVLRYAHWITWLEKQGEHADFRNKIQIGDKVTRNQDGVLVNLSQLKRVSKKDDKQGEQKPVVIPKFRIGDIIKDTEDGEVFIIRTITKDKYIYTDDSFDWIKGQDKYELVGQKPWSEEDEKILNGVIINYKSGYLPSVEKRDKIIEKLESLKGRVQPKNTWKPSDEQMHYLSWIANVNLGDSLVEQEVSKHLNELLEDLKKLREE